MTQDQIIEMARQAFACKHTALPVSEERLKAFAKLVAAAEREACAQIAFAMAHSDEEACEVSAAIRARGQQ